MSMKMTAATIKYTSPSRRKSAIWKKTSSQTLSHDDPLAGRITASNFDSVMTNALYLLRLYNVEVTGEPRPRGAQTVSCRSSTARELPREKETFTPGASNVLLSMWWIGIIGLSVSDKAIYGCSLVSQIPRLEVCICYFGYFHLSVLPDFGIAASVQPQLKEMPPPPPSSLRMDQRKLVTRRFVFDGSKVSDLPRKAASERVKNPTRVEAVCALLWKCTIFQRRQQRQSVRPSVFVQSVDLHSKTIPTLPEFDWATGYNFCSRDIGGRRRWGERSLICKGWSVSWGKG